MAEENLNQKADRQHFNSTTHPKVDIDEVVSPGRDITGHQEENTPADTAIPISQDKDLGSPDSGMAEDFEDDTYDIAEDPREVVEDEEKDERNIWEKIKEKAEDIGSDIKKAFD